MRGKGGFGTGDHQIIILGRLIRPDVGDVWEERGRGGWFSQLLQWERPPVAPIKSELQPHPHLGHFTEKVCRPPGNINNKPHTFY